jgi:hypothetical protein
MAWSIDGDGKEGNKRIKDGLKQIEMVRNVAEVAWIEQSWDPTRSR